VTHSSREMRSMRAREGGRGQRGGEKSVETVSGGEGHAAKIRVTGEEGQENVWEEEKQLPRRRYEA